jgi:hypothetical protein
MAGRLDDRRDHAPDRPRSFIAVPGLGCRPGVQLTGGDVTNGTKRGRQSLICQQTVIDLRSEGDSFGTGWFALSDQI